MHNTFVWYKKHTNGDLFGWDTEEVWRKKTLLFILRIVGHCFCNPFGATVPFAQEIQVLIKRHTAIANLLRQL